MDAAEGMFISQSSDEVDFAVTAEQFVVILKQSADKPVRFLPLHAVPVHSSWLVLNCAPEPFTESCLESTQVSSRAAIALFTRLEVALPIARHGRLLVSMPCVVQVDGLLHWDVFQDHVLRIHPSFVTDSDAIDMQSRSGRTSPFVSPRSALAELQERSTQTESRADEMASYNPTI
jgi:hypothetical protein